MRLARGLPLLAVWSATAMPCGQTLGTVRLGSGHVVLLAGIARLAAA